MPPRKQSWDLTALLNAADPRAPLAARNLWLARLLEWLRHPTSRDESKAVSNTSGTLLPVLRLKHLLNVLERNPDHARAFASVIITVWRDVNAAGLFADVGFAPRVALWSEFLHRVRQRLLPNTADTTELSELFDLLFPDVADEQWLLALDDVLLQRLATLLTLADPAPERAWQEAVLRGMNVLVSAVRSAGLSGALRRRMSVELLSSQPFEQLSTAYDQLTAALSRDDKAETSRTLVYLRALLKACNLAALSIPEHLDAFGISVDIVFEVEQLMARIQRIEELLDCLVSDSSQRELVRLLANLVRVVHERRSIRTLFSSHYSLLARKVAERSAETGEHYITRDRANYQTMLRHAAGGGIVVAGTTFVKFALLALGLTAFWGGFWAGINYAVSFLIIHMLHWTLATK